MDELDVEHTVSVEYTIKQAELTVEAGEYKVSKGYDGTVNPGTGSGEFKVNGLVTGDSVTINADTAVLDTLDGGATGTRNKETIRKDRQAHSRYGV